MFCVKCGATLPDGANFCPNCGAPVVWTKGGSEKKEVKTVQFRCKGCGHVMDIDPDSPVLRCSICGSNELILEGDNVTVQRIKSGAYKDVELGKQQMYKEVELGKKELELKDSKSRFSRLMISFAVLLVGAIIIGLSFQNDSVGGSWAGIIILIAGLILVIITGITGIISGITRVIFPAKDSISKKERGNNSAKTVHQKENHATKEDVELAKVHAKEKDDKRTWLITFLMLILSLGGLFLMYLLDR